MWFIGVEVEQETSAPPPKKNPGSARQGLICTEGCSLSVHEMYTGVKCNGLLASEFDCLLSRYTLSHNQFLLPEMLQILYGRI